MDNYKDFIERHRKEVNAFIDANMFFAFDNDQFAMGLKKLNTTKDKITTTGAGAYILIDKVPDYEAIANRHKKEWQECIDNDATGDGFIFEMFLTELRDHEFTYTNEIDDTLEDLDLTQEDIKANPALEHGLHKAMNKLLRPDLPTVKLTGDKTPCQLNYNPMMFAWNPNDLNGYEPKTTFWQDFSIAEPFGLDAIRDTYNRSVRAWNDNIVYMTEFAMVLNHKIWQHYNRHEQTKLQVHDDLARLYNELWQKIDVWIYDSFDEEAQAYYFRITD